RRLLTKTNRMPRWAERLFPANVAHSVYILEDSIVDPQNQTMTTFTWNINHARLMVVEERCVYCVNSDNSGWTEIRREAWVSSSLFGVSRAVQEFGLARFKSNVTKTMKGFEYILAKLQGKLGWSFRHLLKAATCRSRQARPLPKHLLRQPRKPRRRQRRRHWQLQRRPRTSPARQPPRSSSSSNSLCSQSTTTTAPQTARLS
ncbi:PRELID1 isoform 4, partial [Pan troglodytes]